VKTYTGRSLRVWRRGRITAGFSA